MSLRKVRKKKMVNLASDEEESAKETLFQISYFEEQTHQDQSIVLIPNKYDQNFPISIKDKEAKKKEFEKKKSKSLSSRNNRTLAVQDFSGHMDGGRENKKIAFNTLEDNNTIYNAIQSNRVFVGNKIHFNSARPQLQENKTIATNKKGQKQCQQLSKDHIDSFLRQIIHHQINLIRSYKTLQQIG